MRASIPGVGDFDPLQILRDDPASLRIRLHTNEIDPEAAFDPATLVPANFNGTPWQEVAIPGWSQVETAEEGSEVFESTLCTWELADDGTPQTITGWSLWRVTPADEVFLSLEQFERPIVLAEAGDKIERYFRLTAHQIQLG